MEITREELKAIINEVLEERNKPTDAERRKQIMSIRDANQRQKAIAENMNLFKKG